MLAHEQLTSGPSTLELRIASTASRPSAERVLVLVHGLPRSFGMGRQAAALLPELAEHLANESGWMVATGTLSGVGESTGTFSASQWLADLGAILNRLHTPDHWISLAGFGFGGALALSTAVVDERVRDVAVFATPSSMERWCGDAESFHRVAANAGVADASVQLLDPATLLADTLAINPLHAAAMLPPRRFLIGHGTDDAEVPVNDARELFAAAEGRAELRLIQGAGHQLRAAPRMVATLLGWMDRHR